MKLKIKKQGLKSQAPYNPSEWMPAPLERAMIWTKQLRPSLKQLTVNAKKSFLKVPHPSDSYNYEIEVGMGVGDRKKKKIDNEKIPVWFLLLALGSITQNLSWV